MPSVYIKTYGCQMNERDSEAVAAQLVAKGYTLARSEQVADVVLLNTCSVRDMAEQKALGKMTALAADLRRHRPNVVLGFLGCMAQSRGQELIDRLPDVDRHHVRLAQARVRVTALQVAGGGDVGRLRLGLVRRARDER